MCSGRKTNRKKQQGRNENTRRTRVHRQSRLQWLKCRTFCGHQGLITILLTRTSSFNYIKPEMNPVMLVCNYFKGSSIRRSPLLMITLLYCSFFSCEQAADRPQRSSVAVCAPPGSLNGLSFEKTLVNSTREPGQKEQNMVWVPGGTFSMGTARSDRKSTRLNSSH